MKKRLILILAILLLPLQAGAATYTVCASGCDRTTIQAVFDGTDLSPNDIVEIRADTVGGTKSYLETATVGSNDQGDATGNVVIRGRAGDTIIVDGQDTRDYGFSLTNRAYISLQNLTIQNTVAAAITMTASHGTAISGVTTTDCGYGIYSVTSNNVSLSNYISLNDHPAQAGSIYLNTGGTNWTISDVTITGSIRRGIYSTLTSGITLNDVSVTTAANTGPGIEFVGLTGGTLSLTDVTTNGNQTYGIYVNAGSGFLLQASGISATDNTSHGWYMSGCTPAAGSYLTDFSFAGNSSGINLTNTSNLSLFDGTANTNSIGIMVDGVLSVDVVIDNVTTNNNADDGVVAHNGVPNLIVRNSTSQNNGTVGQGVATGSGDGYSIHDTCVGYFTNCLATGNKNTGIAHTGTSSGTIYNCVISGNGSSGDATMQRAGLYVTSTANPGFLVKNNIISQNYPCDIGEAAAGSHHTYSNNLFNPLDSDKFYSTGIFNTGVQTFTSYAGAAAGIKTNAVNADPRFVSTTDYHLRGGSPAKDTGASVGLTSDYDGATVPKGAAPDIGAYEWSGGRAAAF